MCATDAAGDTEGMKMKINSKDFRVRPGEKVKLSKWPTIVKPFCKSKEQYQGLLAEHVEKLNSLQHLPSLRVQPLCVAAEFSRDGRRGQGRRHPADVACLLWVGQRNRGRFTRSSRLPRTHVKREPYQNRIKTPSPTTTGVTDRAKSRFPRLLKVIRTG